MPKRNCLVVPLLVSFTASLMFAATGTMEFRIRDSRTHYAVKAVTKGDGPQPFSLSTDGKGYGKIDLPAGEYRLEISAPGYGALRTHYLVEPAKTTRAGAFLDPQTLPEEESPQVLDRLLRPGYTLLHEYVVDAETGEPLSGVKVRFVNADVEVQTDSTGHFELSVPTPEPDIPGGIGTDTLIYEKPRYRTIVLRNFGIGSEEMGSAVDLQKGVGVVDQDATHKLMRKGFEDQGSPQSSIPGMKLSPKLYAWLGTTGGSFPVGAAVTSGTPTPQAITVPSSIKVGHNCTVSGNQIVCTTWDPPISLETYVSNGLLGEWSSTWVDDSLEAGAVAYRSYGAWRVAHPLSANYDICDNALCQVYNPTVYKPTRASKADVIATAGVVLSQDNINVFKAEYAAESNLASDTANATCGDGYVGEPSQNWPCMKDFVDTGKTQAFTHSRGMCQRGSQRWASGLDKTGAPGDTGLQIKNSDGVAITPRDWRCILDHYYNANSNSKTVDPAGTGNPGAGSGLRTAFMQGQATYGKVAYEAISNGTGTNGIRLANASDGSSDSLLVQTGAYPTWEPGGKRLAFDSGNGISVINVDGTGLAHITTNGNDFAPSWSPLGDKIAFCSSRAGSTIDVWMMNSDGSGVQRITNGVLLQDRSYETEGCYLRWSPEATRLGFTGVTASIPYASRYNVYTMNSDGSNVTQLTNCQINSPYSTVSLCSTPSWSPDGKKIAFSDGDTPFGDSLGGGGIYLMNPDGSGVTPVFQNNNANNILPQWSSDGKRIFFSYAPSAIWGVYSLNIDGTNMVQIIQSTNKYYPIGTDCSHCGRFDK